MCVGAVVDRGSESLRNTADSTGLDEELEDINTTTSRCSLQISSSSTHTQARNTDRFSFNSFTLPPCLINKAQRLMSTGTLHVNAALPVSPRHSQPRAHAPLNSARTIARSCANPSLQAREVSRPANRLAPRRAEAGIQYRSLQARQERPRGS